MDYLLTAIFYDLKNSTNDHTIRNASKFWHRGQLQISNLATKIPVYNKLKEKLKFILESNGFESLCDNVDKLFDLNELILREGSMLEGNERIWQDRRNFSRFLDEEVPLYLEHHLDTCIQETPVQIDNHIAVCKLTKNDQYIKDFLVENYLISPQGKHMIAVSTAPLVYIVLPTANTDQTIGHRDFDKIVNIHGGVMLAETLRHGYDFSFIGCGRENETVPQVLNNKWRSIVKKRFNLYLNPEVPWPVICWCVGKGDESRQGEVYDYTLSNGKTVHAQPFIKKSSRKKEKVLFV